MATKIFSIMVAILLIGECLCVLGCGGGGGTNGGGLTDISGSPSPAITSTPSPSSTVTPYPSPTTTSTPTPTPSITPTPTPTSTPTPQTTPGIWEDGATAPWYMPDPPKTGISPELGEYLLKSTKPNDDIVMIFNIILKDGKKNIHCGIHDIEIIEGSFKFEWGMGVGIPEVNNWATDAYAISGCFTSSTRCEGLHKYTGTALTIQSRNVFEANLIK